MQKDKEKKRKKIRRFQRFLFLLICLLVIYIFIKQKSNNKAIEASFKTPEPSYTLESALPDFVFGVKVNTELLSTDSDGRPGHLRLIKYIVIHETGNSDNGANARSHSIFLNENSEISTSWHYTVDDNEIYHHIPDNEVAWHAGDRGGPGNRNGIGVELCVNKDGNFNKTFDNAAKLVAYLLKEYNLDINAVKTHSDFTGKDCPETMLKSGRFDDFLRKVEGYLNEV